MVPESQKIFFSQANAVFLIGGFVMYGVMLAGYFEPLLRILILLFGAAGYFVPMLTALAFIIMFSYSRNGTRFFTIAVFVGFGVDIAVILGAWNIYQQAGAISTTSGYGFYGYSYSINTEEVINSAGYIGKATLDYLIGQSVKLRPSWTVAEHMLAIITTMLGVIAVGVVLLSYFVYSPNAGSHNSRGKRGGGRKKVINIIN